MNLLLYVKCYHLVISWLQDYHRFHVPVSGTIESFVDIPGYLYTVCTYVHFSSQNNFLFYFSFISFKVRLLINSIYMFSFILSKYLPLISLAFVSFKLIIKNCLILICDFLMKVNPIAVNSKYCNVFTENKRVVSIISTSEFGKVCTFYNIMNLNLSMLRVIHVLKYFAYIFFWTMWISS